MQITNTRARLDLQDPNSKVLRVTWHPQVLQHRAGSARNTAELC